MVITWTVATANTIHGINNEGGKWKIRQYTLINTGNVSKVQQARNMINCVAHGIFSKSTKDVLTWLIRLISHWGHSYLQRTIEQRKYPIFDVIDSNMGWFLWIIISIQTSKTCSNLLWLWQHWKTTCTHHMSPVQRYYNIIWISSVSNVFLSHVFKYQDELNKRLWRKYYW